MTSTCFHRLKIKTFTSTRQYYLVVVLLALLLATTEANLSEKIYQSLNGTIPCVRRLNATHQVGCGGESKSYGLVKLISEDQANQEKDLNAITDSTEPTVAVIRARQMSNGQLMMRLKSCSPSYLKGILKGILVLETDDPRPSSFSPDRSCPNEYSSLYVNDSQHAHCRSQSWNSGLGYAFEDFPFPIVFLRNRSQAKLTLKMIDHFQSSHYLKLAVQLDAAMFAAKNSVSCLRRSAKLAIFSLSETYCSPMGGKNLFYHSINMSTTLQIEPNSVVVLAARQDSFSLFDTAAPGADSAVSSTIVVLAIAEMLHREAATRAQIANSKRKLLIALFDGEAFDYIGSSDTAYRMLKGQFPMGATPNNKTASLQLSHLSHFIELNQLMQYRDGNQKHRLYLHKNLKASPTLASLLNDIQTTSKAFGQLNITQVEDGHPLPPSSAQSFLKAYLKNSNISRPLDVLVVANHEKEYQNRYYNSFLEDAGSESHMASLDVLAQRLTDIATLFGRVLLSLLTDVDPKRVDLEANQKIVSQLLHCYLKDSNCGLFRSVLQVTDEPLVNGSQPPLSTYVSVSGSNNGLRWTTLQVLRRFTGERMAGNATECQQMNDRGDQFIYQWIYGDQLKGECLRSTAYNVSTVSPAFDEETGLAVSERLAEGYHLWTESMWTKTRARLFLVSSGRTQLQTLLLGLTIFTASLLIVFLLDRHSETLFSGDGNGSNALGDLASSIRSCLVTSSSSSSSSDNKGTQVVAGGTTGIQASLVQKK